MSERDLTRLPADIAAMLAIEARRGPRPVAHRDAVFSRLSRTLALGGRVGGDGGADADGGDPVADPAVSPPPGPGAAATAAASSTAAAVAGSGAPLTKAIVLAGVAFVLGGVAGAGLSSGLHAQRPAVLAPHAPRLVVTVSVVAPAEGPSPLPGASEIQPQATAAPTHASVPAPVRSASSATKGGLAEERALLEAARRAIKAGDVADAFRGLDEHARRFPGGQLGEEREALRVQALVRAGDRSEARRRAEAFRARFPDSAFNPAIDSALGADR